jgi:hypothetical protein
MASKSGKKAAPARTIKPWTVMVYMIADDPAGGDLLDQQANRELDEVVFATLGSDREKLNVAVQVDFRSQPDVWRRIIGEGAWSQPEANSADPETLYGFFEWVAEKCPAEHYLLLLWGHSRGPFGLFTDRPFSSVLAGQFAPADPLAYVAQTLTLGELRTALRNARERLNQEVDIIAFKDCFMSTLETAYELKDAATYILASPDIVPIEGWPYGPMFKQLTRTTNPKTAAKGIVGELHRHYSQEKNRHGRKEVPYSLLDTTRLSDVSEPLRSIAGKLGGGTAKNGSDALRKAVTGTARADTALLDVHALCRRLKRLGQKPAAERLEAAINAVVTTGANGRQGPSTFGGVSVFCYPLARREQEKSLIARHATRGVYSSLAISKTGWNSVALKAMPNNAVAVAPTTTVGRYASNGNADPATMLLPAILEQFERRGVWEEIGRKALDALRRAIAGVGQDGVTREGGFAVGDTLDKEAGFSAGDTLDKEAGFVAGDTLDKEAGFVAEEVLSEEAEFVTRVRFPASRARAKAMRR